VNLKTYCVSAALGALLAVLVQGCGEQQQNPEAARLTQLPEGKLAAIDSGTRNVTEAMVRPYAIALDSLQARCVEPRDRIGDFAVVGVEQLSAVGKKLSIGSFLEMMNGSIPEEAAKDQIKCSEIAAALVVLSGS
jgi:hypothetical protein